VGQYEVGHGDKGLTMTRERSPEWDIGRVRRAGQRAALDEVEEADLFGSRDLFSASISSFHKASSSTPMAGQPMRLAPERPGINKNHGRIGPCMPVVNEAPFGALPFEVHDIPSSRRQRQPYWDLKKHSGAHKTEAINNYYDPGKYAVKWNCVQSSVKGGIDFSHSLSRAASAGQMGHAPGQLGHAAHKAVLKDASAIDRSMCRGGPSTRPRVLLVHEFSKELPRPSPSGRQTIYYDELDPEASSKTLHEEMSFDASTADGAVIPRHDYAPSMQHGLSRDQSGRGHRLNVGKAGLSGHRRIAEKESTTQRASVEKMKEAPSRTRPDRGVVGFDQLKGREESSPKTRRLAQV